MENGEVEKYMVFIGETLRAIDFLWSYPKIKSTKDLPLKEYKNLSSILVDAGVDLPQTSRVGEHEPMDLQTTDLETRLFEHLQWTTFELAHAMRRSLEQGWAVTLPERRSITRL